MDRQVVQTYISSVLNSMLSLVTLGTLSTPPTMSTSSRSMTRSSKIICENLLYCLKFSISNSVISRLLISKVLIWSCIHSLSGLLSFRQQLNGMNSVFTKFSSLKNRSIVGMNTSPIAVSYTIKQSCFAVPNNLNRPQL